MNRQSRKFWSLVLIASMLTPGCAPQQPFYCREDGDLSHYLGRRHRDRVSRRGRIADVRSSEHAGPAHAQEHRQLRNLGPVAQRGRADHAVPQPGDAAARRPSRFDGAGNDLADAREPGRGDHDLRPGAWWKRRLGSRSASPFNGSGTEAALSEFDAQLDTSVFWEKNREPQNRAVQVGSLFPQILQQDLGNGHVAASRRRVRKVRRGAFANNTNYQKNNIPSQFPGDDQIRARFLPAFGRRTSKQRSVIRCSKAVVRNTTGLPVRCRSINTRPVWAIRSTA